MRPGVQGLDAVLIGSPRAAHSVQSCLRAPGRRCLHPPKLGEKLPCRIGSMLLNDVVHVLKADVVLHLIDTGSHSCCLKHVINGMIRFVVDVDGLLWKDAQRGGASST